MGGLQRSSETFRRSGSSGLVWEDRFLNSDQDQPIKQPELQAAADMKHSKSTGAAPSEGNRSDNGYRTGRVLPALDPPSPKISGCGLCGVFGKEQTGKLKNGKKNRR